MEFWKKHSSTASQLFLVSVCLLYCAKPLTAPFFGGSDLLSNLMPIAQFRWSILHEHGLPLTTHLWYGGRAQWANPLWSFLYLPSTLVWLALPLAWAARVVITGHLIFAALAGRRLAALFFEDEPTRLAGALLLLAPITLMLRIGHLEKLLAWPWVLLGLHFLLARHLGEWKRGLLGGLCLGVIPLTGANYTALYSIVLGLCICLGSFGRRLILGWMAGALLGLLHLPSVWHLLGQPRGDFLNNPISIFHLSLPDALLELLIGATPPYDRYWWESFSIVGIPCGLAFALAVAGLRRASPGSRRLSLALLFGLLILLLLATGTLYQGHHLLDTFRVTKRAMPFAALSILLLVFLAAREALLQRKTKLTRAFSILLLLSCMQVGWKCWAVRPFGSPAWLDDSGVSSLVKSLKRQGIQSVWVSAPKFPWECLIHLALNTQGISVPNVYYGDMGQSVPAQGPHCGYSFDALLVAESFPHPRPNGPDISLLTDTFPREWVGSIPKTNLRPIGLFLVEGETWFAYRVVCR